ncbi:ATP-binding protein [Streptomyces sp. NPDC004647]|uniref:ATP-binding protein n=1 Tax=Streptomyces sp. NPDC004647 TaxID=3154671 RepID=UPI0033BEE997
MKSETAATEFAAPTHEFAQLFSSTPRGARLARLMAAQQLDAWGWPYDSGTSHTAALLVAELAANAATHGRLPGRDFQLRLTVGPGLLLPATLRIEVADALGEKRPDPDGTPVPFPSPDSERGRGLRLIDALATTWGVLDRPPSGKTIWAEIQF